MNSCRVLRVCLVLLPVLLAAGLGGCATADPAGPTGAMTAATTLADLDQAPRPVVVFFYSASCPWCKAATPRMTELSEEYRGRATFLKVNPWRDPQPASRFTVRAYPTVFVLTDGAPGEPMEGLKSKGEYRAAIDRAIKTVRGSE